MIVPHPIYQVLPIISIPVDKIIQMIRPALAPESRPPVPAVLPDSTSQIHGLIWVNMG